MRADIEEILYSEEALNARLTELGEQITNDYTGKPLTVISILKGSNIFTSDLVRKINLPLKMDFMAVSSYGNATESTGVVRIIKDLDGSVEGENLLIVEDIVDSGLTLKYLKEILLTRNPASVKICTLLDKPARRKESVNIDYLGFEVPDGFIVGYGIDYAERYRNLPYVGILKRSVYEK
ncbi:hypoxanthine phosphoribosyltransferase [Cellulosilyticum lentocellum]|uniref:Hypoxanthine phosphoribosyltransferase n=1 Tax=Cellulosilyticum lentocellum (strain ATCC 49066 / DSM 5427 / NCIMB 11756 / RHM5) TaxID=642492 RepID=F2JP11_CELLD|nr:hypoxanthine phosphoribosyltransferase [Cellulosilyticum lentocellum]ADZ83625.1 hypoxanthine phosphoribosyltransferase [Cellulosilyticum lentocellum DSM 5427]